MKTALKASIFLNLSLLGCLIFVTAERKQTGIKQSVPLIVSDATPEAIAGATAAVPSTPAVEAKPFNWSQVESADYRAYVANLRGIGCPERTIRDIITADVDTVFAPRREKLEQQKMSQTGGGVTASLIRQKLEAGLGELRDEEARLVAALLGPEPSSTQVASDAPTPAGARRNKMQDKPVTMPLVFQNVDLAALKLDDNRIKIIGELRQSFLNEIGGPNQDPADPAYMERWKKAQAETDNLLHAWIGVRAYQDYQLQATASIPGESTDKQ
jgi:hypothetical protein